MISDPTRLGQRFHLHPTAGSRVHPHLTPFLRCSSGRENGARLRHGDPASTVGVVDGRPLRPVVADKQDASKNSRMQRAAGRAFSGVESALLLDEENARRALRAVVDQKFDN